MDFFARQDSARKQTGILLVSFTAAILLTSALVYFVILLGLELLGFDFTQLRKPDDNLQLWHAPLFFGTFLVTLIVVTFGSILKKSELSGGGPMIATQLGGRPVLPDSQDFYEVRLRNIVEEMAIASGVPVPQIYLLENERGINAFAAGFRAGDAVVAVTYGTMVGLSRDELQGVIAHEFSHILNGDMRMNLDLIGWLHGLTAIAGAGKGMLHSLEHVRGRGSLIIVIVGGGLFAVGSMGNAFAGLIKSLISKQREILADASAVQFTRNPGGLAGALKKIGGLVHGSRLHAAHVDEVSHMCFGNGLRGTMFPTHPPLKTRIQWLEPGFDGHYENVTLDSIYATLAQTEGAPRPRDDRVQAFADIYGQGRRDACDTPRTAGVSPAPRRAANPPKPINGHALLESIGKPMLQHEETARALIASIPDRVREYAGSPYGARMLIYFMLLDRNPEIQAKQLSIIKQMAEPEVFQTLEAAVPNIGNLEHGLYLPIIDLTIPALRFLSVGQYRAFMQVVKALVLADGQTDIFEYALQRVLSHHLEPLFEGRNRKRPANFYSIRGLVRETSILLSVLARKCHDHGIEASSAFMAAVDLIDDPKTEFVLLDKSECSWDRLDLALDKLNEGSGLVKKQILSAALTCMMFDRKITVEEVELFRAIAVTLDCPVPPWVTPLELDK
ncbi:M48 family metalloprotease [Pontiellaceae bacterium B1224]|nr:M48 family metalloprotease [Pontiellaceae bacterium B1224]